MKFRAILIILSSFALSNQLIASEKSIQEDVANSEIRKALSNLDGQQVRMKSKPLGLVLEQTENSYAVFDYWSNPLKEGIFKPEIIPAEKVTDGVVVKINGTPNLVLLQDFQRKDYVILKNAGKNPEINIVKKDLAGKCKYIYFTWSIG